MDNLPIELALHISSFLCFTLDLLRLQKTSKLFRLALSNNARVLAYKKCKSFSEASAVAVQIQDERLLMYLLEKFFHDNPSSLLLHVCEWKTINQKMLEFLCGVNDPSLSRYKVMAVEKSIMHRNIDLAESLFHRCNHKEIAQIATDIPRADMVWFLDQIAFRVQIQRF